MTQLGLAGSVALVAGTGPGLGSATAVLLAEAGAQVVLAARRRESLDAAVDAVEAVEAPAATGQPVTAVQADLATAQGRAAVVASVAEVHGHLDVLVYNASSTGANVDVVAADLDAWRSMMEVNLWAGLSLVQEALPLLSVAERPRIVFVSAMTTRVVSAPGRGGYSLSKAALNQAVRTLAFELGPRGIRVNGVLPGWMETPTVAEWRADPARSAYLDRAVEQIPLGRIPTPEQVAGSVLFLASRLSEAVTGVLLDANGGQYMPT